MNKTFLKKEPLIPILIFILAFGFRLGYLAFLKKHYFFYDHPSADVVYYQNWARLIASGHWLGSPTFQGLPLYPYFLGFLMRLTLGSTLAIRIIHLLLGSLNCILVFKVAQKIFTQPVAIVSGLLAASNFYLIYYDWLMMPVTLIITLSLVIILSLLSLNKMSRARDWFLLGLMLGLTILADGKFLFFLFFISVYLMARLTIPYERKLRTVIVPLTLGAFLILCAMTVRNKIIFNDWIFISPQSGLSFYVGNNPQATGIFENPRFIRPSHSGQDEDQRIVAQMISKKELPPAAVSKFWRRKGWDFIRNQPLDYGLLLGRKLLLFLKDTERAHDLDLLLQSKWRRTLNYNPFFILCPLALLGIILALQQKRKEHIFLLLLILSQLILTLIFFLITRHRITILPLLLIYESFFLVTLVHRIKKKKYKHGVAILLPVIVFMGISAPERVKAKNIDFIEHAKKCAIFEKKGQLDRAKSECMLALNISPSDSVSLYNLGNVYFKKNNLVSAKDAYERSLAICSYNIDALFNLGYVYEKQRNYIRALESYKAVLEFQPAMPDVHYRMAQMYLKLGHCEEVNKHIQIIMTIDPSFKKQLHQLITACPH